MSKLFNLILTFFNVMGAHRGIEFLERAIIYELHIHVDSSRDEYLHCLLTG